MAKRRKRIRPRVPGTFQSYQKEGLNVSSEPQRIVLYLPIELLDRIEQRALTEGMDSLQRYCEQLIINAFGDLDQRPKPKFESSPDPPVVRNALRSLDENLDLIESLSEAEEAMPSQQEEIRVASAPTSTMLFEAIPEIVDDAVATILQHAGINDPQQRGLLSRLRASDQIDPNAFFGLWNALEQLENSLRESPILDRRLGFALHRLGFEGQILVSEPVSGTVFEEHVIQFVRLIQEKVDRILSGQDIRYSLGSRW